MKAPKTNLEEINKAAKEVLGDPLEPIEAYTSPDADPLKVGGVNYPEEILHLVSRVIKSLGFDVEELETLDDANEFVIQWRGKVEGIPVSGAYRTTGDEKYKALAIAFSFAMNMHPGSAHFLWMADAMQYRSKDKSNSSGDLAMRRILLEMHQGADILLRLEKRYNIRSTLSEMGLFQVEQKKDQRKER